MQSPREFPLILRFVLPLLAAGALLLAPRAVGIRAAFLGESTTVANSQPKTAAQRLVDLAQWEPWRSELWEQAGRQALSDGNPALAIRCLEQSDRLGRLDELGRSSLGEAYWISQNPEAALAAWEPLLRKGRVPQETYRLVVQYQRSRDGWESAARTAQIWWQVYPDSGQAAWIFGTLGFALNWGEPAGTALQLAGSLIPARAEASQILLKALRQIQPTAPDEYRAVQIGRALGSVDEWNLALMVFKRAQAINPGYADAWAFGSEAKQHLDQDGLPDLKRALALSPDSAVLQALAGVYYRRIGDAQQALTHFAAAAGLEPARGIWQVEVGSSYADLHNTQKGLDYYHKAVELEPQNPLMWQMMARYCLNHDLAVREVGLPAARQAVVLAPEEPGSTDLMAQVLVALGDEASAEQFLQQSLAKNVEYPAAYLHLGQLYLRLDRPAWAEYFLARAAQLPGEDPEAALLAQRLLERYFR